MKIHADNLGEVAGTHATPAQEGVQSARGAKQARPAPGASGESVQISDLANRISEAVSVDATKAADRVSAIAAQYARGQYRVDAVKLSQALVANSLGGGAEGGDK